MAAEKTDRRRQPGPHSHFAAGPLGEVAAAGIALSAVLCAVFWPVVFTGRTFAPNGLLSEQAGLPGLEYAASRPERAVINDGGSFVWIFQPMAKVVHDTYADGSVPLWNPYSALGAPNAASFQTAPAGPFYVPLFLRPTQGVWDLVILVRLLAGGLGLFVLARLLDAGRAPAFLGGLAYMLLPAFVLWAGGVSISVEALFPWLLAAVLALARRPTARRFAAVALLVAAAALGGQPEVLVVLAYLAAGWALYWWWRLGRSPRRLAELAGAGLTGGLLAAPQLWLGGQYVRHAFDFHEGGLGDVRFSFDQFRQILLGDFADERQAALTIVVLALAVGGVAGRRRAGVAGTGFLLAATAVWAVRAFGVPGQSVIGLLPGIDAINVRRYGEVVLMTTGCVLAAADVQALLRGSRAALAATAATMLVPLVLWAAGAARADVLPALLLAVLTAGAAALVLRRAAALSLLGAVLVAELVVLMPRDYAARADAFRPQPFVTWLRRHLEPGERVAALGGIMHPQIPPAFGLPDARIEDALYPKRYERYIHGLAGGFRGNFAGFLDVTDASSPFLAAAGVRYVLTRPRASSLGPDYRIAFRDRESGVTVWRSAAAFPRAWVVGSVEASAGAAESFRLLQERGGAELARVTVVENPTGAMRAAVGSGSTSVERIAWNDARYRVSATGPAVLTVSDQFFPGWRATVDGRETPIRPANLAMRAVAVPAGEHVVRFEYDPAGRRYGRLLALLGLGVLAARVAASIAQSRR